MAGVSLSAFFPQKSRVTRRADVAHLCGPNETITEARTQFSDAFIGLVIGQPGQMLRENGLKHVDVQYYRMS